MTNTAASDKNRKVAPAVCGLRTQKLLFDLFWEALIGFAALGFTDSFVVEVREHFRIFTMLGWSNTVSLWLPRFGPNSESSDVINSAYLCWLLSLYC